MNLRLIMTVEQRMEWMSQALEELEQAASLLGELTYESSAMTPAERDRTHALALLTAATTRIHAVVLVLIEEGRED